MGDSRGYDATDRGVPTDGGLKYRILRRQSTGVLELDIRTVLCRRAEKIGASDGGRQNAGTGSGLLVFGLAVVGGQDGRTTEDGGRSSRAGGGRGSFKGSAGEEGKGKGSAKGSDGARARAGEPRTGPRAAGSGQRAAGGGQLRAVEGGRARI